MPARLVQVTLKNRSSFHLHWIDDTREHGDWQEPWYPSNIRDLAPGEDAAFRLESAAILTGCEGSASFMIDVPQPGNQPAQAEILYLWWARPFYGMFRRGLEYLPPPPPPPPGSRRPHLTKAVEVDLGNMGNHQNFLSGLAEQVVVGAALNPLTPLVLHANALSTHVRWGVEVRDAEQPTLLPANAPAPAAQDAAVVAFRGVAGPAAEGHFAGAFPTFVSRPRGELGHAMGAVFVTTASADWRDVPLADMQSVPLNDFVARMQAANVYASREGFVGGFPTFHSAETDQGTVVGTVLLRSPGAEWREVPRAELGNVADGDIEGRFRATHAYAVAHGFVGGFPTFFQGIREEVRLALPGTVRVPVDGTVLISADTLNIEHGGNNHYAEVRYI